MGFRAKPCETVQNRTDSRLPGFARAYETVTLCSQQPREPLPAPSRPPMNEPPRPAVQPDTWSRFGAWRDQRLARLAALAGWLGDSTLDPSLWQEPMAELERRLQRDQVQLAFVAELSRGKSELINALFFGSSGQRVLPAGVGRTTMCPVEIFSDREQAVSLRLLPIETRAESRLLSDWKARPQQWQEHAFAAGDAVAMSRALQRLCDTMRVPLSQARELGFYLDEQDAPTEAAPDADELVEIPRWRHALLNIEHPLLAQGISVLDTPGLNALGAEPELTLSLIPSAAAVVFLLAADAGVTRSDLQLWTEHVGAAGRERSFVVLNKVDALWDPLRSSAEVQSQIRKQCESVAQVLQVAPSRVFALSAHKGLLARIQGDDTLLQRSGLPQLETALGVCADRGRRDWLEGSWRATLLDTRQRLERDLDARLRQHDEQRMELESLQGKSKQTVAALLQRAQSERSDIDAALGLVQAVQSVNARQLARVEELLAVGPALQRLENLRRQLRSALLKTGLRAALADACEELGLSMNRAESVLEENQSMLAAACMRLNNEFAFSVPPPKALRLDGARLDLEAMRADYLRFAGAVQWLRLQSSSYVDRVLLSAQARLRNIQERGVADAQHWNRAAMASLQAQARERRRSLHRRLSNLQQVAQTDDELARRIEQLRKRADELRELRQQMRNRFELALPGAEALPAAA